MGEDIRHDAGGDVGLEMLEQVGRQRDIKSFAVERPKSGYQIGDDRLHAGGGVLAEFVPNVDRDFAPGSDPKLKR